MGGRWSVGWRDALLPGALALGSVLELVLTRPMGWQYGIPVVVVACAMLVLRRPLAAVVSPLSCLTMFITPYVGPQLDEGSVPIAILVLAQYSLGRYTTLRKGVVGVLAVYAGLATLYLTVDQRVHGLEDVLFLLALFLPPFVLGRIVQKMAAQREQLVRQQELIEREAARGERLRIARELHDVLAHSLSAMVVQAAAARDVVRADPAAAEAGLDAVADAGRSALAETGRLLHVLRDDADELALGPAPTLARLDELVADARRRGLDVTVTAAPDASAREALHPGVSVCAYRIVQESLTNALRHSTDGTADLQVTLSDGHLTLTTSNPCADGRTGAGASARSRLPLAGSGLGIAGIAERVALFDGGVEHGVRHGRYVLTASLRTPRPDRPPAPAPAPDVTVAAAEHTPSLGAQVATRRVAPG